MIKSISKSVVALCCLTLFMVSCDKEEDSPGAKPEQTNIKQRLKQVAAQAVGDDSETPSTSDENLASECIAAYDCFEYVFPITVKDADNNERTVNSEEELWDFYDSLPEDFFEENDPMVYPITVRYEDGSEKSIANVEELDSAYAECFGEEECFAFDFPIAVSDGLGTETVINGETDFDNFYLNLPEDASPEFVYPFTVTLATDGSKVTVQNDDEFDAIYLDCYGFDDFEGHDDFECFEIKFPITVISNSGETQVSSEDELIDFYVSLEDDEDGQLKYPIDIVYEDGTERSITSEEEMESAFEDCFINEGEICYDITYPINLKKNEEATTTTVNNDEEFDSFLDQLGEEDYFDIAYPINILLEDGSKKEINSDEEFIELEDMCFN
ncbi:hypothetical protein [Flagellimonas sp. 2504JD1-5]